MEDAARFGLNDEPLCRDLKTLRHELRAATDALPIREGRLEAHRNVDGDVGTEVSTKAEMSRGSLHDVVVAAGKRLAESLRVIEEMAKTLDPRIAHDIESLRYRAYGVDKQLRLRFGAGSARQWRLCVLLTKSICRGPWNDVLCGALDGGADCIQVREKQLPARELIEHVRVVMDIAKPRAAVIVNDRADVALAAGADGVHLGQTDLSVQDVRRIAGRELLVGVSTHDLDEAREAVEAGADYSGVGTMFPTTLKPEREPAGPRYLREFVDRFPQSPHLAIGGITAANIHQMIEAGARGIAVSTAVCGAADAGAMCRQLLSAFEIVNSASV
jgi:thiamine-phosphate pyrophosphorylase